MDEKEITTLQYKYQALRESVTELTLKYEEKVAGLRAELTMTTLDRDNLLNEAEKERQRAATDVEVEEDS